MLAAGDTPERLLQEYPFLELADIQPCLAYAHGSMLDEAREARDEAMHVEPDGIEPEKSMVLRGFARFLRQFD